MTSILFFLLACGSDPTPSPAQPAAPSSSSTVSQPQANGASPMGSSPAEDLSTSWKTSFGQAQVPQNQDPSSCPDQDGDGFVDALICGNSLKSELLDCDDQDPKVTPENERWIPAGPFIMGSASDHAGADEKPVHMVFLSGYCLDRDEVSVSQWASWLQTTGTKPTGKDIRSLNKAGEVEKGREKHPAEGVIWEEAQAYCTAMGKTLPTEAQWEKAARGGCELGTDPTKCDEKDLRPYPWGFDQPSCDLANHQLSASGFPKLCVSDTQLPDDLEKGSSPYGHRHMAGNVWEYVADYWHPKVYGPDRKDPGGPSSGEMHVLRGGGWNTFSTNMRTANRFHDLVMGSASGFRCSRPTIQPLPDNIAPLTLSTVTGSISSTKALQGRALYVSAFDAADADENGMLAPGRSPVSEAKLVPNGETSQAFTIQLPTGGKYILSAALDAGTGAQKEDYISASGSGGFGHAEQNPVTIDGNRKGITISLQSPPTGGGPGGPPGAGSGPGGPPPNQKNHPNRANSNSRHPSGRPPGQQPKQHGRPSGQAPNQPQPRENR